MKAVLNRFVLLLLTVLSTIALSCSRDGNTIYCLDPEEPVPSTAPLVTVIYNADALGDRSYNDIIYRGVEHVARENGLRTAQLSPQDYEEGLSYLKTMFDRVSANVMDSVRQLYIICAAGYDDYIRANNHLFENNPYADLLYLETSDSLVGKGSTLHLTYYGAMYEMGALLPVLDRELLFIAANPVDVTVSKSVEGFASGFNRDYYDVDYNRYYQTVWNDYDTVIDVADKNLRIMYLGSESGDGFNVPDSTLLRITGYMMGGMDSPTAIPVCGGSGYQLCYLIDILNAGRYAGIDHDVLSPNSPISCVKHIDRALELCIRQWLSPQGLPKHQSLGLADGYTEVIRHFYNDRDREIADFFITDSIMNVIRQDAIKQEKEHGY